MALEIKRSPLATDQINVWSYQYEEGNPKVGIGFGPLFTTMRPHEARELAHHLIEAADAATRKTKGEAA